MSAAEKLDPWRRLYVVEFLSFDGWHPMCGDSYLDREEAERVSKRSDLPTRVVEYGPVQS